jgi:glutathione S-transferase
MQRQLFELVGADDRRFSPYCWRTRLALAHKGLEAELVPCRFREIAARVAFAGHDRVPVLKDGDRAVGDSWAIACYLEDAYPDRPSLFGDEGFGDSDGRRFARFVNGWVDAAVSPPLAAAIIPDVYDVVDPADRDYFRGSRERRFGKPLAALRAEQAAHLARLRTALAPARAMLAEDAFLAGPAPRYPDFALFGTLQWARCSSPAAVLEGDDPVAAWFERMLDLYDAAGRSAPARAAA